MISSHSSTKHKLNTTSQLILESPKFDSIPKFNHLEYKSDKEEHHNKTATSSTPLFSQEKLISRQASTTASFKLTPHKQANHSRLKHQTSPYSINNSHYHIAKLVTNSNSNNNNNNNSSSCSSSVSNSSHSFLYTLNTSLHDLNTSSTTDDSQNASTKTNPPSTPVLCHTSSNNESNSTDSSPIISKHHHNDQNTSILYVTPASTTSPSTTNVSEQNTGKNAVNSVQAYSRSSSYTSLSSCDLKSIHSSLQSEYTTGFHTPFSTATYSGLPDSPGDQMDLDHPIYANSNAPNNHYYINSAQKQDELSMITVDSNPSKSNDITIIERTILATSSLNHLSSAHSSGGTRLNLTQKNRHPKQNQISNSSSAYNSESNSFLVHQTDPYDVDDDEEKVVSYDMEGSLCGSTSRSNVSCLTFPNEPTADITFIRNLLAKKSNQQDLEDKEQFLLSLSVPKQQKWSLPPNSKQFTPPVKLVKTDVIKPTIIINDKQTVSLNRSLFHGSNVDYSDEDNESIRFYNKNEDEADEVASISSIPSEIRLDRSVEKFNKTNFDALMKRLTPTQKKPNLNVTYTKDDSLILSPSNANNTVIEDSFANYSNSIKKNIPNKQTEFYDRKNSNRNSIDNTINEVDNLYEDDNDQKILYEFIDEMFPKSYDVNDETTNTIKNDISITSNKLQYDQEDGEENINLDEDEDLNQLTYLLKQSHEQTFTRVQQQQQFYKQELPIIDEDIEEDNEELNQKDNNAKSHASINHLSSLKKHMATMSKPAPVIQMTKTARLRFNKLNQEKNMHNSTATSSENHSKRLNQQKLKTFVKENLNAEIKLNQHLQHTKSSSLKSSKPLNLNEQNQNFKFMNNSSKKLTTEKAPCVNTNNSSKPLNVGAMSAKSNNTTTNNTKINSILTTVNFHSNTFNFNYKN